MPTFYVEPSPTRGEITQGVIAQIIAQHQRLLPEFGWSETDDWKAADLCAGHLGAKCPRLDVFHLHGLYPTGTLKLPRGCWEANAQIIANLRRAGRIVAVSEWVADIVRRDMRADPVVVGHGIDVAAWQKVQCSREPFAAEPYVLWNKTRTLGVCDPSPVLALAESMPDVRFVTTFLPDGSRKPPNVHVTGLLPMERMWRLVKGATAYLATTMETFGVGILEAMASGVPVVGYDWGALPDLAGGAALLVEPNQTGALADALRKVLDKEEAVPLVETGVERARLYDWHPVVETLARAYESCLSAAQAEDGETVAVVIPCYNYARYVGDAIRSVLAQTHEDLELIVVDDGSTDDSATVIRQAIAGDGRARLIEQRNTGVSEARNRAIRETTAPYVCCLDADDMMQPGLLEACLPALREDTSLAMVYTGLAFLDKDGNVSAKVSDWPNQYDPAKGLEINQVPTCCLYRRSWWRRCGGYKTRFLSGRGAGQEDGDLWFNMLAHGGGARKVTDEPLFLYRFHPLQATRNFPEYWKSLVYKQWYPWAVDGQRHPMASQLLRPDEASLPVYHYDRPRVAVVIPVGPHHRGTVGDAVDSVCSQSYRQWELIIVNDSGQPLDGSAWPFARMLSTDTAGMGPGHARNLGTALTKAPLVVYLDADDVLQPRFIEETLRAWLENGNGWVYTDFFYMDATGKHRVYETADWNVERAWEKGIAAVTALYPVEAWREVGGFDEQIQHEDWEFHIKITLAGWCGTRLAEPLITYRHDTGTRREEGIKAKGFMDIKKRYSKEKAMGCNCGRGGGRKTVAVRRATSAVPAPPPRQAPAAVPLPELAQQGQPGADYVLVRYVGKSDADLVFRGRDGRQYVFSTKRPWCWVHPLDAGRLVQKAVLQRYDGTASGVPGGPALVVPRTVQALGR